MVRKILFKGDFGESFLHEVRKRVDAYFHLCGLSKNANWILHLKAILLISCCILFYCCLWNAWLPWIPRTVLWIGFGVSQALIAVNLGHDALHGSYSRHPMVNKLLGYLAYDCIGLSSTIWKQTHNKEHHTYTNIAGADPDIDKPGLLRLSPHDPYYPIHRYQHGYIWILYSLVGLNWILISDYMNFWKYRARMSRIDVVCFFFFKAFNLTAMLAIPLLFFPMPWWEVILGYLTFQLAGGFTVAIIFQLAHLVENVSFPLPDDHGNLYTCWGEHEMATTSNFATHDPLVTHIVGGLNFQIEHHLFPKISHCHYLHISPIVKQAAKEYGLPYHEQPGFFAAVASHTRFLKNLGRNASCVNSG